MNGGRPASHSTHRCVGLRNSRESLCNISAFLCNIRHSDEEKGTILVKASVERQSKMSSFKSGLRRSQRYEDDFRRCAAEAWNDEGSFEERTEYRRRGSSLPTHSSWVNVKILPSLRHSTTDPDICIKKTIPKDVIETDYLRQTPSSSSNQIPDGTTAETTNNNKRTGRHAGTHPEF